MSDLKVFKKQGWLHAKIEGREFSLFDLKFVTTSRDILHWILHYSEKSEWVTAEMIHEMIVILAKHIGADVYKSCDALHELTKVLESAFGYCPKCSKAPMMRSARGEDWATCPTDKLKWKVGENLFSSSKSLTVVEENGNRISIDSYETLNFSQIPLNPI